MRGSLKLISFVLQVATFMMAGCSGTNGLELSMFSRDATGAEVLYEVKQDGTLGFGGGLSARLDKTTWTGALTPEESQELHRLLEEQNWFQDDPPSDGQPEGQTYRVMINTAECRRRFSIEGESPGLKRLRELLAKASLRRLDSDLKKLPLPSSQR